MPILAWPGGLNVKHEVNNMIAEPNPSNDVGTTVR